MVKKVGKNIRQKGKNHLQPDTANVHRNGLGSRYQGHRWEYLKVEDANEIKKDEQEIVRFRFTIEIGCKVRNYEAKVPWNPSKSEWKIEDEFKMFSESNLFIEDKKAPIIPPHQIFFELDEKTGRNRSKEERKKAENLSKSQSEKNVQRKQDKSQSKEREDPKLRELIDKKSKFEANLRYSQVKNSKNCKKIDNEIFSNLSGSLKFSQTDYTTTFHEQNLKNPKNSPNTAKISSKNFEQKVAQVTKNNSNLSSSAEKRTISTKLDDN